MNKAMLDFAQAAAVLAKAAAALAKTDQGKPAQGFVEGAPPAAKEPAKIIANPPPPPPEPEPPAGPTDKKGRVWGRNAKGELTVDGAAMVGTYAKEDPIIHDGKSWHQGSGGFWYRYNDDGFSKHGRDPRLPAPKVVPIQGHGDIQPAGEATIPIQGAWSQLQKGQILGVNDQWNAGRFGLKGKMDQTVYLSEATAQGNASVRIVSHAPAHPTVVGGGVATEVITYPRAGHGQFPGQTFSTHPKLPIKMGDINHMISGYLGIDSTRTRGHGHLAHDMRIMDTPNPIKGYSAAAKHIRQEAFVIIEQYDNYGIWPGKRNPGGFHGTYNIGGVEWYFFNQPGASTDPNGGPNPQLIWMPVVWPLPNPLDWATLFEWAMTTTYKQLKQNAPGRVQYGSHPDATIIDPSHYFTSSAYGVEVVSNSFDVRIDTPYLLVD